MKKNILSRFSMIVLILLTAPACIPIPTATVKSISPPTSITFPTLPNQTAAPTWPPPFPTHLTVFYPSATPSVSEISGFVVYHDLTPTDSSYQLFIENLSTQEIKQLTYLGTSFSPDWSPDGKQIVFSSVRDGKNGIYVMNADGSDQQLLILCPGEVSDPSWSPNGGRILFFGTCNENKEEAVYVIDIKTHELKRLTFDSGNYLDPSWSSKGDRVAFVFEDDKGNGHIYSMYTDGSNKEELASGAMRPIWCPDDTCIVYQKGYGQGYVGKLMIANLETKETKPLLPDSYAAPENVNEFLSTRSPVRGYITFSIRQMLYAMDLKKNKIYSLGLQTFGGSLYP